MFDADKLIDSLIEAKQNAFDEMVEGNGRQPHEVVEAVIYQLIEDNVFSADVARRLQEVVNYQPVY